MAVLVCAFVVAGCHASIPKPEDVEGYEEGETYLSMWVHSIEDTEEGQCYRKSVEQFNEKYNGQYYAHIEFIPRNDSGGGYSDKINASVMSGDLPDVLTVDGPNVAAYAMNGIIQPLAPLTEAEEAVYLPSIIEQGTYQGELYALGAMESSVGMYYNKDILEKAGVEIPDMDHPWTWPEFLEICGKLKPITDEMGGYVLDMTFPVGEATIYYYAPMFWSNGGELVDDSGLNVDGVFNSDTNAKAVDFLKEVLGQGYMSSVPVTDLFESGRAAFKFDGAWEVNTIYNNYPDVKLGVAPYIVSEDWDGGRYTPTGSWAYAASTKTEHIDAATELVKWMSGIQAGKLLWDESKSFPSTYEAFESSPLFQTDPNYKALYEQLSTYGHPRPKTPVYPQVSSSFQQVLEDSVITGDPAQSTLDKMVPKIDAKLKRYILEEEEEEKEG